MHLFEFSTPALLLVCAVVLSPWVFLVIYRMDHKRTERMWRETLVYLKSASAFEAEDAIDRIKNREKTMLEKGLAKMKKQSENLNEDIGADMATELRGELRRQYASDTGTGK